MNGRPPKPADSRRIAATLANPDMRRAYAEIVLGRPLDEVATGLNPARRKRVLRAILESGLAEMDSEKIVATGAIFKELLTQHPAPAVAQGVDRFLRPNGMIDRYPANPNDRRDLLFWIAGRTLSFEEILTEPEINERLREFSEDFAVLRRYLVDFEILERSSSGSSYARVPLEDASAPGIAENEGSFPVEKRS
jgi:hypothetical protein